LSRVKPTDLTFSRYVGAPTLHPSGENTVVAVRRIDLDSNDYPSQLWLVPTDEGTPRRLTFGARDTAPAYSPDGKWLAFLRAEKDSSGKPGQPQLWVMPSDGGEARRLSDSNAGVEALAWNGDSTRLAFTARQPEDGRYGTADGVGPEKEAPRRVTKFSFHRDGIGYFLDRPKQIWVVDAVNETAEPKQITNDDLDHDDVRWNAAGDLLAYATPAHETRHDDLRQDIWVCAPDGSGARAVTSGGFDANQPWFSPDGASIYFVGSATGENDCSGVGRHNSLWRVPLDGSAAPVRLTDEESLHANAPIAVGADGILFPNENRGAVELLLIPFDDGEPQPLLTGPRMIQAADMVSTPSGPLVAASFADGETWGDVLVREWDGEERVVTDFNAEFREKSQIHKLDELVATAPDGYQVHGWVVRPDGDGPHPVLLMIHGGPFTQYGWQLFDEAQVYAGAGYAVVMSNPRGSSGYGQAHGQAVIGNVGEVSTADLMAILDEALKAPDLDESRVGVLGGSHGGFMTTWLAAHEGRRFKAAVSERAVNAIDSFTGSSDIGWFFADDLYGPDIEGQRRQSPLTYADQINIPMLIIHSENDWRCPIEQAHRLYVALRKRGQTAEMLIFPGEGHELTRSGLPSHRVARFDAILEWFGRHI
jgi:dipeptidyl aminopeptidase/acylaminoacyl peptidase